MLKVVKTCAYDNKGSRFNILPALLITPLIQVADYVSPTGADAFMDPELARALYPVNGMLIALKWWTFHIGIELHKRGTI